MACTTILVGEKTSDDGSTMISRNDAYKSHGDPAMKGIFRPIGINRNDFMVLIQMRPDVPEEFRVVEWIAFALLHQKQRNTPFKLT